MQQNNLIEKIENCKFIASYNYYTKHGLNRIYCTLWSQNRLPANDFINKFYYDFEEKNWMYTDIFGNKHPGDHILPTGYSGKRTKKAHIAFVEEMYE